MPKPEKPDKLPDLHTLAQQVKAAQDSARQIEPFTTRLPGFHLRAA